MKRILEIIRSVILWKIKLAKSIWNFLLGRKSKKEKNKKKIATIFLLLIGIISTLYLFKLEKDTQGLYERKNSLDIAYAEFLGLHTITQINPWQGLSGESLQTIYRYAHFSAYGENPSDGLLNKIDSRVSYEERIGELKKIKDEDLEKNKILEKIEDKQTQQIVVFLFLILSQIGEGLLIIKSEKILLSKDL